MRVRIHKREIESKENEEKVASLTSKLDSLVKFLEEERSIRKKLQEEMDEKEKRLL